MRLSPACAIAAVLLWPAVLPAATVLDCDRPGTPYVAAQLLDPPEPHCLGGGPTGAFLRLADTASVNRNSVAFDLSDPGAHTLIVADFDFRMRPRAVDDRADGFGFTLVSTDRFGTFGFLSGGSEEPNLGRSLGIGFDIHHGPEDASRNHVSIHWDSVKVAEVEVSHALDLANGHFDHARIVVRSGLVPAEVDVILTPCGAAPVTVVDRFPIPGLVPYEARVQLMGRSGGESALHDLDNLIVQFVDPGRSVVSFARGRLVVTESDGRATLTLERLGNLGAAAVTVSTGGFGATAGSDYEATSVVVPFAPGEAEKTVTVPLIDDADFEDDETFVVRLSDPTGVAAIGGPDEARVTIADDEAGRVIGHWDEPVCLPVVAVHATVLPQGVVMFWPGEESHEQTSGGDHAFRWDPVSGAIRPLAKAGFDIFCSGHTLAADGRLFVAGGHRGEDIGLPNAAFYDPVADAWERLPDMNAGRWYPSATLLPNGDLLVTAGSITPDLMNDLPQVWDVRARAWRDLTGARLGEEALPRYYPWMFVVGENRVFCAGRQALSFELDPRGAGAWTPRVYTHYGRRSYGSSAMAAPGRILIAGGSPSNSEVPPIDPPTATAELMDLSQSNVAWRLVEPMTLSRRHLNLTLLPDGGVLATGGTQGAGFNNPIPPALQAERWDPVTETWTRMAAQTEPRLYHSIGLLLPDGRVMSAGGGQPSPPGYLNRLEAEIFSPPYLFRGPRPVFATAPASVRYGETFLVETPDAAAVEVVRLIGLSSVTHTFNSSQRVVRLDAVPASGGLWVTLPADSALCPPAPYLLFLVTADGVPSQGRVVRISGPPRDDVAPPHGTRLAIHGTLPQPAAAGPLRIWLTLERPGPATLALYDVTGRAIGEPEEIGTLGVGSHVVTPRTGPARSGVYLARVTQGERSAARRIVVLK